jgi:hypothetical protein
MIPNAVTSTGDCAGFWSYLKSIDHALERVLGEDPDGNFSELDRDRLAALLDFLRAGLATTGQGPHMSTSLRDYSLRSTPDYTSTIDLRRRLVAVQDFEEWQKSAKKGTHAKLERLASAVEEFLAPRTGFLPPKVPREEFQILRAIIGSLLAEAETALLY